MPPARGYHVGMLTPSTLHRERPRFRPHPYWGLALSLLLVTIVAVIGGLWTKTDAGSWYDRLDLPPWVPPSATFAVVWPALYVMMAVAAWLVWMLGEDAEAVRRALVLYVLQLALNLAWTGVFFGAHRPGWAIVEIALLFAALVATMVAFRQVSVTAFWLLVPYALWTVFAASLTIGVAVLNA